MMVKFIDNKAFIEEVCIDNIINSNVTPFYLYSQNIISETYNNLKKELNSEIYFSVKSNSNQSILRLMKNCGAGADVVSIGELERSLAAGFNPSNIIFEGVGKSKDDLEYAINKNIKLINCESINEIILVDRIAKNLNKKIKIGIRFNPNIDGHTLDKISTGKKTDKFGINISKLTDTISLVKKLNNIQLKGISCHIGSQISDLKIYKKVFTTMRNAAETVLTYNIALDSVDLGGGLFVNYDKNNNDLDISGIGDLIKLIFKETSYTISFEPGRYLVAKAGIIITKILMTKDNGGVNFLITDAGMNTFIRPAMYNAKHRIEAINNLNEKNIKYTVAGPICESSDIIAKDIFLPEQQINDYLIIHDTGAYGAVMSSNYNSRGIPSEILVNKNKFCIIYKQESITEIIKKDIIPSWL